MKNLKRSISSVLLILMLLISLFIPSYANESVTLYAVGQPAEYSTEYNSGTRDVVCTTLDGTSAAEYYKNYDYDTLSLLSEDSLFNALHTLMKDTHLTLSSYDDCHYKANQTDCQDGDGSVSLIYTAYSANMSQWNGWNREHVWPQSLGGGNTTGGGADLHHIRPSDSGVNSSRGNKKYGESGTNPSTKYGTDPAVGVLGGTYNSNYFEPNDNVKGDVARICLYVYVRWNSDWGATNIESVFQSIDILLEWCEMDPVDTWEMGRNEVVGAIQGNRNVFIDYPEYAWLLFGEEVPENMITPSGKASGGTLSGGGSSSCEHANQTTTTVDATCTVPGSITVKCDDCKQTLSTSVLTAPGHSYVNGVCQVCGEVLKTYTVTFINPEGTSTDSVQSGTPAIMPVAPALTGTYHENYVFVGWVTSSVVDTESAPTVYRSGDEVEISGNTSFYALYSYETEGQGVNGFVEKSISEISSTDVVIITMTTSGGKVYALPNNGGASTPSAIVITVNGNTITASESYSLDNLKWNISNSNNNLTIYPNGITSKWLYCTNANAGVKIGTNENKTFVIDATSGYLKNTATNRYVGVYTTNPDWRCYDNTTGNTKNQTLRFFVESTGSGAVTYYTTELSYDCIHPYKTTTTVRATCTKSGSITVTCDVCGATVSSAVIEATGHVLVDNVCIKCGYIKESDTTPAESVWTLVTDTSELKAGDKIIIVSGTFVAGDISNAIMASVSGITLSENGTISSLPDGAIILTLGGSADSWTLSNEQGKLLGATTVKKLAWDSGTTTWSISIANDGSATIKNQNSSFGRFLYNVTSPRFTTYTSNTNATMLLPMIYKYEGASVESEGVKIESSSMTIGSNLAMNYYVSGCDKNTEYYMLFTMNGVVTEKIFGVENNGRLVFSFTDIPPQFMGDNISASLYSTDDETPVATIPEHSVRAYAEKVMELYSDNTKLINLIEDMLRYGAAAQMYRNYKTSNLVTDGLDLDTERAKALPTEDDNDRTMDPMVDISTLTDSFTAIGVRFDFDNKIYFKIKTDDISKIKITVNGEEINVADQNAPLGGGVYIFYTSGINATMFDEIFTLRMYVDDVLHQTVTYSVNSYVYAKCGDLTAEDESTLAPIAQLVRALYRYGLSAKAYVE